MQEIQEGFFVANATHLLAEAIKLCAVQQTMLAFGGFALLVLFEHLPQPITHLYASRADGWRQSPSEAVARSFLDVLVNESKIEPRACAHLCGPVKGKIVHLSGRMEDAFVARVALALNDQHGSICSCKGAEVIDPVGKRAMTEG